MILLLFFINFSKKIGDFRFFIFSLNFFQIPFDIDFYVKSNTNFHKYSLYSSACEKCKYHIHFPKANSTPKDVVIAFASKQVYNIALFIRTLRNTESHASCVFILDKEAISTIDQKTLSLIENCGAQIIECNVPDNLNFDLKNYFFHLIDLFLRKNEFMIDRVIICDLYDYIFQLDPFHSDLPKNQLHLVDEGVSYNLSDSFVRKHNIKWIESYDPSFVFTENMSKINFWCAGYVDAPVSIMIRTLELLLSLTPRNKLATDQGGFNYLNLSGKFLSEHIIVAKWNKDELVRHTATIPIREAFMNVKALNNPNLTATGIHHYYTGGDSFFQTILSVCPRPDSSFHNYLSKTDDDKIALLEKDIKK